MSKTAALFSGQGSQYPGMGKELYEQFTSVREIYTCASDIMGFDVAKTSQQCTEQELSRTAIAQPVTYTLSIAAFTAAMEYMEAPHCVAGHSLGEFAALYCAGAFGMEAGFRIIAARAKAMEQAAQSAKGAMYAVIGSDEETIRQVCDQVEGLVEPVNYNLPSQTVISGAEDAAAKAVELLQGKAKKIVRLSVGSAFHTSMMEPAAKEFKENISNIDFLPLKAAFYSNVAGGKLEISDYPEYFARHMVSPVRFVEQMAAMVEEGVTHCVEFGPKRTVATLAKKNQKSTVVHQVEDKAGLEGLKEFFS